MATNMAFFPALKLSFAAGQDLNEDQALILKRADIRLIAAFDGCGGVGGRRYPQMDNHTGAYIAAGLYAGCLKEWFRSSAFDLPRQHVADELTRMFAQAAREYHARYLNFEPSAVTGSMVRALPSTAAVALIAGQDAVLCWAGNTRAYLLTDRGLRQLTADDLATQCDAFESLYLDAPISNYLCADQPFVLHEKTVRLPEKGVLILATDGAFHALLTPMHFEALLLDTLAAADTIKKWKKLLQNTLRQCAADDVTLLMQPFGFGTQDDMKRYFDRRRRHVRQAYILPAESAERESMTALRTLWDMYQRD